MEKDCELFPFPDILIGPVSLVCGQKGYEHKSYSRLCKNELDDFKRHVQEILDNKPYDLYEEGLKLIDLDKFAKMKFEIQLYELFGLEDEYINEKCFIF